MFNTTEYDEKFRAIKYSNNSKDFSLGFMPWVGKEYANTKKKLFVIGERFGIDGGNHGANEPGETATWPVGMCNDFLKDHDSKPSMQKRKFFNAVSSLLLNTTYRKPREMDAEKLQALWRQIAHTNHLQTEAGNHNHETYERSRFMINAICEIIQPTHIWVISKRARIYSPSYIDDNKPALLETSDPTAQFAYRYYVPYLPIYRAVIKSWNL